jgi:hypothetical protein
VRSLDRAARRGPARRPPPGDPTLALDASSGARLGALPLPPPARFLCDDELGVAALDAEGFLGVARLSGRMGVLGDED